MTLPGTPPRLDRVEVLSSDRPAGPFGYAAWVRQQRPELADALILERPGREISDILKDARARGVAVVVSGFLPDEQAWDGGEWLEDLRYFQGHFEFQPFRLRSSGEAGDFHGRDVLYLHGSNITSGGVALAEACAHVLGVKCDRVNADGNTHAEVVGAIDGARIVVNDVDDWSLGFAIDEYVASTSRGLIRLRHPGYSPIRYAVLGLSLPPQVAFELPRLRSPVSGALKRREHSGALKNAMGDPFGAEAKGFWRRVMGSGAFDRFWAGMDWREVGFAENGVTTHWLENPAALAALSVVANDEKLPADVSARAIETVNGWLACRLAAAPAGRILNRGVARLVRLRPDWLMGFRRAAGSVKRLDEIVSCWVEHALVWEQCDASRLSLVLAEGIGGQEAATSRSVSVARAWAGNWAELRNDWDESLVLPASWRRTCVEALTGQLRSPADQKAPATFSSSSALLERWHLWLRSFGGAAAPLRIATAVRMGRLAMARSYWRNGLRQVRLPATGGVASLTRALSARAHEATGWLGQLATDDYGTTDTVLVRLLTTWNATRRWDLWKPRRTAIVEHELRSAVRLMSARASRLSRDHGSWRNVAIFAALCRDARQARQAIEKIAELSPLNETPALTASALAMLGAGEEARELLQAYPAAPGDPVIGLFLRALSWQLLDQPNEASIALDQLICASPGFLEEKGRNNDALWVWGAVVMRRSGLMAESRRLHQRALSISRMSETVLDDYVEGARPIGAKWREFFLPDDVRVT